MRRGGGWSLKWMVMLVTVIPAAIPLQAEEPAAAPAGVVEELARLNRTVQKLVAVVERQLEGQRLELLMRQVEIKRAKVTPLEQALRAAREGKDDAEEQLRNMQLSRDQMLENVALSLESDLGDKEPTTEEREQMEKAVEQMTRQHSMEIKLLRERIVLAEERIQLLENDLAPVKAELQHWEALVDGELAAK